MCTYANNYIYIYTNNDYSYDRIQTPLQTVCYFTYVPIRMQI